VFWIYDNTITPYSTQDASSVQRLEFQGIQHLCAKRNGAEQLEKDLGDSNKITFDNTINLEAVLPHCD
jgi:hypothetical protein